MSTGILVNSQGCIKDGDRLVPIDPAFLEPGVRKYNSNTDSVESIIGVCLKSTLVDKYNYILVSFYPQNNTSLDDLQAFERLTV
jgi:hypothetical protein